VSVENSKPLPEYEMAAKIGTAAGFALGRIMREFDVGLTYAEQTAACGIIAEAIESVLAFTRAPQEAAAETEYAKRLAGYLWRTHYKETAPNWEPFDDLMGLLSQIDNMTCRLVLPAPTSREAAAAEGEAAPSVDYEAGVKVGIYIRRTEADQMAAQAASRGREEADREHAAADRRTEALIYAAANLYAVEFNQSLDAFGEALRDLYAVVRNETATIDRLIESCALSPQAQNKE
jgi:hypothetical protein